MTLKLISDHGLAGNEVPTALVLRKLMLLTNS